MKDPFTPRIIDNTPEVNRLHDLTMPQLGGVYGSRLKEDAELPLQVKGYPTPVYAKWSYGAGRVGSFMCDLEGKWSGKFMESDFGFAFINNVLNGLFPPRPPVLTDMSVGYDPDNFTTRARVTTALNDGEYISARVSSRADGGSTPQVFDRLDDLGGIPGFDFVYTAPGVYDIEIVKRAEGGRVISTYSAERVFSYSEEYDAFRKESEECRILLATIAQRGRGRLVDALTPEQILEDAVKTVQHRVNPLIPFVITASVLFLLDMAVRKFKFKWPWEIVRERKAKAALRGEKQGASRREAR
jgi:hypothetical protein